MDTARLQILDCARRESFEGLQPLLFVGPSNTWHPKYEQLNIVLLECLSLLRFLFINFKSDDQKMSIWRVSGLVGPRSCHVRHVDWPFPV